MKWFVRHPAGNVHGVLFDTDAPTREAMFLTPQQAKFEAAFRGVREGKVGRG
jgi:hypothetical protein